MPWRVFWMYLVGVALIAASLSIVTRIQLRWSALLVGILMFLFVAMIFLPGAIRFGGRLPWTVVVRESSFGGAGLVVAGTAMLEDREGWGRRLITVGRVPIGIAAVVFGVLHFFHPLVLPGVPLAREMPTWIPARPVIDYLTGALLVVAGVSFLLARQARLLATWLGAWIVLMVVLIYTPVLLGALADPRTAAKVEGISYFADTLLFGGVILSLACAMALTAAPADGEREEHS